MCNVRDNTQFYVTAAHTDPCDFWIFGICLSRYSCNEKGFNAIEHEQYTPHREFPPCLLFLKTHNRVVFNKQKSFAKTIFHKCKREYKTTKRQAAF